MRERFPELLGAVGAGVAAARWPGRLETLDVRGVPVVLDGAHNLAACEALIAALDDDGAVANQLVFGALADKQAEPMLRRLATAVDARHYCEPLAPVGARRSVPTDALAAVAPGRAHASPEEAIEAAVDAARQRPGGRVLVTGSLFLVGRVRAHLLGEEREMEVPL